MNIFKRRFVSLAASIQAIVVALAANPLPAQAAPMIYVDIGSVECPGATFSDIQSAVDAAMPGNRTITVCPGLYGGPVTIDGAKNLKLIARPGVLVVPLSYPVQEPVILVNDSTNITVQGFTISGLSRLDHSAIGAREVAIDYRNSNGTITGNTIENWHTAGWVAADRAEIIGIGVTDERIRKTTITNNILTDFQGVGILLRDSMKFTVSGNTLTTELHALNAQYGIRIIGERPGALTGTISGNTIIADAPVDDSFSDALSVVDTSNVRIVSNTITRWGYAMTISAGCPIVGDTNNITISQNTIREVVEGIEVFSEPGLGACHETTHVNKLRITGNTIANTVTGMHAVMLVASSHVPPAPSGLIKSATVTGNTISGFRFSITTFGSDTGVLTGRFTPNTISP